MHPNKLTYVLAAISILLAGFVAGKQSPASAFADCEMGPQAPALVAGIKVASNLPFWSNETCAETPLATIRGVQGFVRDCTWDDGSVVLRVSHSKEAQALSFHLNQKVVTQDSNATFKVVAGLLTDRIRSLQAPFSTLVDNEQITQALNGGAKFQSKGSFCFVTAGFSDGKLYLSLTGRAGSP